MGLTVELVDCIRRNSVGVSVGLTVALSVRLTWVSCASLLCPSDVGSFCEIVRSNCQRHCHPHTAI